MVDARLKGEWLTAGAHDGLSDAAYRIFHNGLMHCNEQGTNGVIVARELRFLYPGVVKQEWLDELEQAGFWSRTSDGYEFREWTGALGQSTATQVEAQRAANRERKRRERERRAAAAGPTTSADAVGTHPWAGIAPAIDEALMAELSRGESRSTSEGDVTEGVGKERIGQERKGQERTGNEDGAIPFVTETDPVTGLKRKRRAGK